MEEVLKLGGQTHALSFNQAVSQEICGIIDQRKYEKFSQSIVFTGREPSGMNLDQIKSVAEEFGVRIYHLPNSSLHKIIWAKDGGMYSSALANIGIPCDLKDQACDPSFRFYSFSSEDNSYTHSAFSVGRYLALNVLYPYNIDPRNVLDKLSVVKQPGMGGGKRLYVFFDPNCSVCRFEFSTIQSNFGKLEKSTPDLSILWVPVDIFSTERGVGKSQYILRSGFKGLYENYSDFSGSNESGGARTISDENLFRAIVYNDAALYYLALKYGVNGRELHRKDISLGTPVFVTVSKGVPQVFLGGLDSNNLIKFLN